MNQAKRPAPGNGPAGHLLRLCLSGRWDPSALERAQALLRQGHVSWDALHQRARAERLAPQLYNIVRQWDLVPPSVRHSLRRSLASNTAHNTLLFNELGNVLQQLATAGVQVILIKGAALSLAVHRSDAVRVMADLDLLVPADRVDRAHTALASLSYSVSCLEPWPGHSRRYRNVLEYQRPLVDELPCKIDLHWGLVDVPYYSRIPIGDWFARAQPVQVAGVEALVPAAEDHLICLCGQLALHDRYDPALFRYYDMAALIRDEGDMLDWHGVVQRAVDWQLVIPLQRALAHLEALWPGTVPAGATEEVAVLQPTRAEALIHRWVVDRRRNRTSDVLLFLATLRGRGRRARYLLEQGFPSPAYMRELYCPRRPGLWPLSYLQRAGLTLWYLLPSRSSRPPAPA